MKNTTRLIKLAESFSYKYANPWSMDAEDIRPQIENSIKIALTNASQQPTSGIMPFVKMAQQDQVDLSFDVTRNDTLMNKKMTVSNVAVSNPQLLSKYSVLKPQIETYLTKNWELFPSKTSGLPISYNNFTIHLNYPAQTDDGDSVAQY